MEFRTHFGPLSAALLAVVGTTTYAGVDDHTTRAFTEELAGQYRALAEVERASGDYRDAERYAARAAAAAVGEPLAPTAADTRGAFLEDQYVSDLDAARSRLVRAYDRDARHRAPAPAARAESSYECWLEQAAEDLQPAHITACRDAFMTAIAAAEHILDTPVAVAEPPPPPAPAPQPEIHRVYFDFNEASLTTDAAAVLERVHRRYAATERARIRAIGWADTVGSGDYNLTLSRQRAAAVKRQLVELGVPATAITTAARGEENLPQPTADGVREARNRQVELTVTPEA
tara:strand:+ start:2066 stop:2932 length:867 start_codon:yes stop_codon:yes gene_type:complete